MMVQDVMTGGVLSCRPSASLADAVGLMWTGDCGIVPVVDDRDAVVGVITDRDIAVALGTRGCRAADLQVGDVMSSDVIRCTPADRLTDALALMRQHRVRRLPVVGLAGELLGMLSINDVVVQTPQLATSDPLVDTLRTICAHHHDLVAASPS
ncbi:MAG: CBS domain-containing protein [Vicinamibacterales bacterium]